MPTDIQNARVTQALVDFFTIKGRFRPQLDEVVVPVVLTADMSERDEETTQPAVVRYNVAAAGAGLSGKAVLFNGVTGLTGVELLIDSVVISNPTGVGANDFLVRESTNAPIAPIAGSFQTKRFKRLVAAASADPTPPGNAFSDSGAFAGDVMYSVSVPAGETIQLDVDLVMEQLSGLVIAEQAQNQQFFASINYRVRSLAP